MSVSDFVLTSQTPYGHESVLPSFDRLAAESQSRTQYDGLSRLCVSISSMTSETLADGLPALLHPLFKCDLVNIVSIGEDSNAVSWRSSGAEQLSASHRPFEETTVWSVWHEQEAIWVADWKYDQRSQVREEAESAGGAAYRSLCRLPLSAHGTCFGVLSIASSRPHTHSEQDVRLLSFVADQLALRLENSRLHDELQRLRSEDEDADQGADQLPTEPLLYGVVGKSPALLSVLRQLDVVAPTDSGVLIQGETGTGKELIAQAIHNRSPRRDRPFIKVNCAAIPSGLLESELFGHEKGAFTGAVMRKPGRFELADKGTLFLDEVGDIPLDLQAKLLRVLQEREFERLGSTHTQRVDVRVVAATHRDLKQMVEDGTFRRDLYYRLHIFPLAVPPLRDRREDIPLIVRHFVDKFTRRMNRSIKTIPARTMEALVTYSWPGNVRELQNFIERAVILSPGPSLFAPLEELQVTTKASSVPLTTIAEMEREHVIRALRESNWVTGGPNGAAVRLGMKRTTLAYRIRKLGITLRPQ
jgi:formate hydrogenlyase transcriptional activator